MRDIILALPSQAEIAAAMHATPAGQHRDTVRRMATALDVLRSGGWEFVRTPRILPKALGASHEALPPPGESDI